MKRSLFVLATFGLATLATQLSAQAGMITFSDLTPWMNGGLPGGYTTPVGIPAGVTATFSAIGGYSQYQIADHTGDAAAAYIYPLQTSNATITFSEAVVVPSLFMYLDSWSSPNPSTVTGLLNGTPVWTGSASYDGLGVFTEVTNGVGQPIDQLSFAAQYTRVDDITVNTVPEPASLALLGMAAVGLLARRRRA